MRAAAIIVGFDHWHNDAHKDGYWTREFVHALQRKNPDLKVLVVDNASRKPYQSEEVEIVRIEKRVGYAEALNVGLMYLLLADEPYDWYVCLNNDCQMKPNTDGNVLKVLETLDPNVLYGSGENRDTRLPFAWQWSAWLVISQRIFKEIGYFDDRLSAAFEDFDYEKRAMDRGFTLDTAHLPIEHLDMHTRYEDPTYPARWDASRQFFQAKHNIEMKQWYTDHEIEKASNA